MYIANTLKIMRNANPAAEMSCTLRVASEKITSKIITAESNEVKQLGATKKLTDLSLC